MADHSSIEWTDATWSPTLGCDKVSEGCRSCYAIRTAYRQEHGFKRSEYSGLTKRLADGSMNWTGRVNVLPNRLDLPLTWRKPRRIFVDSQSDLFHEDVPDEFIDRVFAVIAWTPQHTYQLLTKRPERMLAYLTRPDRLQEIGSAMCETCNRTEGYLCDYGNDDCQLDMPLLPFPNVWLGVSVEDQRSADERIPLLLQTPAAVRFLSCEPLLGSINFDCFLWKRLPIDKWPTAALESGARECVQRTRTLHWVIAGGESGPGYRPMDLAWIRSLRDQCKAASVPFFAKQNSGPRTHMWLPEDVQSHEFPETAREAVHA